MFRSMIGLSAMGLMTMAVAGCGGGSGFTPKLAPVTGTVTADGGPASGVVVTFEPQKDLQSKSKDVGQASSAVTDANGKYELNYSGVGKGAIVGKHIVRISNMKGSENSIAADPAAGVESNVVVPAKYNTDSTMVHEVKSGPNTIDLEIKTK